MTLKKTHSLKYLQQDKHTVKIKTNTWNYENNIPTYLLKSEPQTVNFWTNPIHIMTQNGTGIVRFLITNQGGTNENPYTAD